MLFPALLLLAMLKLFTLSLLLLKQVKVIYTLACYSRLSPLVIVIVVVVVGIGVLSK